MSENVTDVSILGEVHRFKDYAGEATICVRRFRSSQETSNSKDRALLSGLPPG